MIFTLLLCLFFSFQNFCQIYRAAIRLKSSYKQVVGNVVLPFTTSTGKSTGSTFTDSDKAAFAVRVGKVITGTGTRCRYRYS